MKDLVPLLLSLGIPGAVFVVGILFILPLWFKKFFTFEVHPDRRNQSATVGILLLAIAFLWLLASRELPGPAHPPSEVVFDAVSEFSDSDNPSGSWYYGLFQSGSVEFSRLVDHSAKQGFASWSNGGLHPTLGLNQTSEPIMGENDYYVFPVKMLFMHPGLQKESSVLRWIAARPGTYRVVGSFEGMDRHGVTSSSAIIYQDSQRVLFNRDIDGFGPASTQHFDFDIQVSEGEPLDFVVGVGHNGNYYSDSTGLDVIISHKR